MHPVGNADIREPCVELREDYEVSLRASAPRRSSDDGDMGERNDERGGCHRGIVVEVFCKRRVLAARYGRRRTLREAGCEC